MLTRQKISFVIPAYNCASTIEESIDSIFNKNFEIGDEVIVVNDKSTDATASVLEILKKKYPLSVIENSQNIGCSASRNVGIRASKNPLIFNLDADNVLASQSITPLAAFLIKEKADIAAFSETRFFTKKAMDPDHTWIYPKSRMTLADFLAGYFNPGLGGNFLYTKKSWEKIGGYWEYGKGLHDAWGFTFKQLINGATFAVMPHSYYLHRYGIESVTVRELKKHNESYVVATAMMMHGIDLINEEDAAYIQSEKAPLKNWIDNIGRRPIRLKSGEIGTTGYKITLKNINTFSIKNMQQFIFNKIPAKIYFILKKNLFDRYDFTVEIEKAAGNFNSLLDVGCGARSPIKEFKNIKKTHTLGIDLFDASLEQSKKDHIHDEYKKMDIRTIGENFAPRSFECVLSIDTLEHVTPEEGYKLLDDMEKIASKRVVVFTPNGFIPQDPYEDNDLQIHKSGWNVPYMQSRGYRVIGIGGWKPLRKEGSLIRFKPRYVWEIISGFTQVLFAHRFPRSAYQMLCVKDIK